MLERKNPGMKYNKLSLIEDKKVTADNRKKLFQNTNLLFWYESLYSWIFKFEKERIDQLKILEIGSGTSPLKHFYPTVMTSDILDLDYLDLVFDCCKIDQIDSIPDYSLDIITFTNVLHHVQKPIEFLLRAEKKLKSGGRIIMVEPYFSMFSKLIYNKIHHEYSNANIQRPEIDTMDGPLRTANIILPYLIFFSDRNWFEPLFSIYRFNINKIEPFSFLSYFFTGGISKKAPIPKWIYKYILKSDLKFTEFFPKFCSSFFILTLTKKNQR